LPRSIFPLGKSSQLIIGEDVNASLFCAGGPVSNQASRLALQYRLIDPANPALGLFRIKEPVFNLRYEYICNSDKLAWSDSQRIQGLTHEVPDWSILDTLSGRPLFRPPGVLDYLIITMLPQMLDASGYEHGHKLVIVAGGHGIGTLATVPLLRNEEAVRKLLELTKDYEFWQALIPLTGTATELSSSTIPTRIDIDKAIVAPVIFERVLLERAFQFAFAAGRSRGIMGAKDVQQSSLDVKGVEPDKITKAFSPSEIDPTPIRSATLSRSGEGALMAAPIQEQSMSFSHAQSQGYSEPPPTVEEIDLYYTARSKLTAARIDAISKYANRFPSAERSYQALQKRLAAIDQRIADAIRAKNKKI
jgi:hypothetical protein